MSDSLKMRDRALNIIPGGNSLLSKRSEMFSPSKWPGYFSSSNGIIVKDLDNKKYKDFSHFSVGTCTLGYSNPKVNDAVKKIIDLGTMSTLNCPEEVILAEKLVSMHSWAGKVRFARTGGEANAVAIRVARAATGKDKVLINGYHGWHDWYLSVNLTSENNLDGYLLPGLVPAGVPKGLANTVDTFPVGDLDKIRNELESGEYAAIKMEVMRNVRPSKKYLQEIRSLCDKHNTLLIFDECTSGFREAFGGMHLNYGIFPDMCMLGKAIANGFPLTCVLGTHDVMNKSSSSFISSTFWTERIGFTAALATLDIMEKQQTWKRITKLGEYYKDILSDVFEELDIEYEWSGMPALIGYSFKNCDWQSIKTKITEELLDEGYLHGCLFYPSTAHTENDIEEFKNSLKSVLSKIKITGFNQIEIEMKNKKAHNTFKRLN